MAPFRHRLARGASRVRLIGELEYRVFPINIWLAEADGNRTRQGPNRPLTGFEDRGTHQASGRLLDEDQEVRQA